MARMPIATTAEPAMNHEPGSMTTVEPEGTATSSFTPATLVAPDVRTVHVSSTDTLNQRCDRIVGTEREFGNRSERI